MNLLDFERALESEVKTGRLGVPVALRIHAMIPGINGDILGSLGLFRPLFSLIGNLGRGHVQAKQHPSGQQLTVLWTEESGKTVFLTLATSAKMKQALHLLLIGSHGMAQLEGGEAWCDTLTGELPPIWEKEIQESLQKRTSIPLYAS